MKNCTLDCTHLTSRALVHSALAQALCFPEYYGRNLDALHDCLTDISQPTHLTLTGWDAFSAAMDSYACSIRAVLEDSAEENRNFTYSIEA